MSEPFVFRFKLDEAGTPRVMYVADVRCACGLCGHEQMQRFYHSTPFHPLTVERLSTLAAEVHLKADYECENCGVPVGPEHAEEAALIYGCPDDAGLVRAFVDEPSSAGSEPRFELIARRRLDPQALPGFEPDEERGVVVERLTEGVVEKAFDRVFNSKLLWLELFEDWRRNPRGGAFAKAAPGCWFALDEDEVGVAELGREIRAEAEDDELLAIPLLESAPADLATHDYPAEMPGRLQTWLVEASREMVEAGRACAMTYVSARAAVETIERTFEVAQLDFERDDTGDDASFLEITTPGGERYGRSVSIRSVLRRAVYTGITPGEAGRLTAEEIAGMLLRIW